VNWDAIAAVGEAVGAAGVIASLVYLAVQIRQNSQSVRRAGARQTGERNAVALRALADHPELFSGGHYGFDRFSELDESHATRFTLLWTVWMQGVEQSLADVREGILEPEYAAPYQNSIAEALSCPGGRQWWAELRPWFTESFQREVDRLIGDS
jgi:hypothetical protein